MKLIVLSITPYKEKDGIVTAISENEILSFSVRGILDPKSKNHFLNTFLIEVDADFQEGNYKHKVLKSAKLLDSPFSLSDSLDKLAVISLIQEATKNLLQEEEQHLIYPKLKHCLAALKNKETNVFHVAIHYLFEILRLSGNELELNGCVYCGSRKEIAGLSFAEGGFVCKSCIEGTFVSDIPLNQLLLFRKMCLSDDFNHQISELDNETGLLFLRKIAEFIYSAFGIKLKNMSLF